MFYSRHISANTSNLIKMTVAINALRTKHNRCDVTRFAVNAKGSIHYFEIIV